MDPITAGAAVGAVSGIIQGIVSSAANSKARAAYEKQMKEVMAGLDSATRAQVEALTRASEALAKVGVPAEEALQVSYQRLQAGGQITPETAAFVEMGPSELSKIQEDPRLKQVRLDALARMQEQATRGITPEIEAAIRQQEAGRAQELQSATRSILEQQAQRGMSRSGGALLAQLNAAQQQANRASLDADRMNAMMFQNQNQAISKAEQLAGGMMREDFERESTKARAQDEISRLNNSLSLQARQSAASIRNQAQQANLQREQAVMDQNTALANKEVDNKRQNVLDTYDRQMRQAQAQADIEKAKGNAQFAGARDKAYSTQGMASQLAAFEQKQGEILGSTIGKVGGAASGGLMASGQEDTFQKWLKSQNSSTSPALGVPGINPTTRIA
jgi:hypothetical protein